MLYTVCYANELFAAAKKLNVKTAYKQGADVAYGFSPADISRDFYEKNRIILDARRGNGYWLWKPYFIKRVMEEIQDGDCLVYADAGMFYLNDLKKYEKGMRDKERWLVCQETGYEERKYTKRDAFVYMELDRAEYTDTIQRAGGAIALIKCDKSMRLIDEWLKYACDPRIITDIPNTCGKDNYDDFIDHRQDQSIFSLLTKKYGAVTDLLFEDFALRKKSGALLCFHHSGYGGTLSIALHREFDPYWWRLKDVIKSLIGYTGRME